MLNDSMESKCDISFARVFALGDSLQSNGAGLPLAFRILLGASFFERCTNERVAIEYAADSLQVPIDYGYHFSLRGQEYNKTGYNYAVANASVSCSDIGSRHFFYRFSLEAQLNALLKHHTLNAQDLVSIMIGANDVKQAYFNKSSEVSARDILNSAVQGIGQVLRALHTKGVRAIILANVPNLGLIPFFRVLDAQKATRLSQDFNEALGCEIIKIQGECPNLEIKLLDLFSHLSETAEEYRNAGLEDKLPATSNAGNQIRHPSEIYRVLIDVLYRRRFSVWYNRDQAVSPHEHLARHLFYDSAHVSCTMHQAIGALLVVYAKELAKKVFSRPSSITETDNLPSYRQLLRGTLPSHGFFNPNRSAESASTAHVDDAEQVIARHQIC